MADNLTVIERLEGLLNQMEAAKERAEEELKNIKDAEIWRWCQHTTVEGSDDPLPVPRLELHAQNTSGNWYVTDWYYVMVYRHALCTKNAS